MGRDILTEDKKYTEIGINYRFFLAWRQALFVGYFAIIGVSANFFYKDYSGKGNLLFFLLFMSVTGALFWLMDRRNQSLYNVVMEAGKNIEIRNGNSYGIYKKLIEKDPNDKRIGHSKIIGLFYLLPIILLFLYLLIFRFKMILFYIFH